MPNQPEIAAAYTSARERDPQLTYAQFVWDRHLEYGRAHGHATIGGRLASGTWANAGRPLFEQISKRINLLPTHRVVDYGCGTARLGYHLIQYLERGNYRGLDPSAAILEEGKRLIGPQLLHDKEPRFDVNNRDSVTSAAESAPDIVLSTSVSFHVHPDVVADYYADMARMAHSAGARVYFDVRISPQPQELRPDLGQDLGWVVTWSWPIEQVQQWMRPLVIKNGPVGRPDSANPNGELCWVIFGH